MSAPSAASRSAQQQRIGRTRRIDLVAGAIAQWQIAAGRRFCGQAERAVKGGVELGRVAHDRLPFEAGLIQCSADRCDPAILHVAGRHAVGAGLRELQRRVGQRRHRGIVQEVIAVVVEDAAVAVRGV